MAARPGPELFFDVESDPHELWDLSRDPAHVDEVALWRARLVDELRDRPEGFTDGQRLLRLDGPTAPTLQVW